MLQTRTSESYLVRAQHLEKNEKDNYNIVRKLRRQARKAKERELAQSF